MPHTTCSMPDCESPVKSKGKCNKHYSADYRAANPDVARRAAEKWRNANRDKANAAARASKAKDPARVKKHGREYYHKNKDLIRPKQVAYYNENRDHVLRLVAQQRMRNIEARREATRKWAAKNPEKRRQHYAKRRAWKKGVCAFAITDRDIRRLEMRYLWSCAYCAAKLRGGYHLDHVVPLARGGSHSIGNLVPACQPCNNSKSASTVVEWRRRQARDLKV